MDTCLTPKTERTELSMRSGGFHRSGGFDYDEEPRQMEICSYRHQTYGSLDQTTTRPIHRVCSDKTKVRVHRALPIMSTFRRNIREAWAEQTSQMNGRITWG